MQASSCSLVRPWWEERMLTFTRSRHRPGAFTMGSSAFRSGDYHQCLLHGTPDCQGNEDMNPCGSRVLGIWSLIKLCWKVFCGTLPLKWRLDHQGQRWKSLFSGLTLVLVGIWSEWQKSLGLYGIHGFTVYVKLHSEFSTYRVIIILLMNFLLTAFQRPSCFARRFFVCFYWAETSPVVLPTVSKPSLVFLSRKKYFLAIGRWFLSIAVRSSLLDVLFFVFIDLGALLVINNNLRSNFLFLIRLIDMLNYHIISRLCRRQ